MRPSALVTGLKVYGRKEVAETSRSSSGFFRTHLREEDALTHLCVTNNASENYAGGAQTLYSSELLYITKYKTTFLRKFELVFNILLGIHEVLRKSFSIFRFLYTSVVFYFIKVPIQEFKKKSSF